MHRYGTRVKGGNSGMNRGYDDWNYYDFEAPYSEYHRMYRRRERASAKKEIDEQVEEYYNPFFNDDDCSQFCNCDFCYGFEFIWEKWDEIAPYLSKSIKD